VKPLAIRGILLDIEGTTSSISFVHDVMFPYVRQHLADFLQRNWTSPEVEIVKGQLARDDGTDSWADWLLRQGVLSAQACAAAEARILELMDADAKTTGLKTLQGLIWKSGFHSGALEAQIFDDVLPAIEAWRSSGIDVRIYSSGSIAAQRLFFGHIAGRGNCLHLFSGNYDTTIGGKKEAASYSRVAADWGLPPHEILFISDLDAELAAAAQAGLQVAASLRPGNAPLPENARWPRVHSFADVSVSRTK
jgi:enolase-phosphatase E1